MNSQALQRVTSLVIAIALVMIDTNAVRGQRDVDPAPGPIGPKSQVRRQVKQANATAMKPQANQMAPAAAQVGKTTVKQASATKQVVPASAQVMATDPVKSETTAGTPAAPKVTSASTSGTGSVIKQAGYEESTKGITADGVDPLLLEKKQRLHQQQPSAMMTPPSMGNVPMVHGALMNLRPGEAASERLIQAQMVIANLEREAQELRQIQTQLQAKLKERDEQLLTAIREIQLARKEVGTARVDLDRLKGEVQSLREKARVSEKEHESLLRSMGPLLQQLLDGNEVSALPPHPPE